MTTSLMTIGEIHSVADRIQLICTHPINFLKFFLYFVTELGIDPSKNGHFHNSKSIFKANFNTIILKTIFYSEF